jgi:hypothetical protein
LLHTQTPAVQRGEVLQDLDPRTAALAAELLASMEGPARSPPRARSPELVDRAAGSGLDVPLPAPAPGGAARSRSAGAR